MQFFKKFSLLGNNIGDTNHCLLTVSVKLLFLLRENNTWFTVIFIFDSTVRPLSPKGLICIWSDFRGSCDWHVSLAHSAPFWSERKRCTVLYHTAPLLFTHTRSHVVLILQLEDIHPVSGVLSCPHHCFLSTGTSWFPRTSGLSWFKCEF